MKLDKNLAELFVEMLCGNEESMAEQAAFLVTCSQLKITKEEGYKLMRIYSECLEV